MLYLSKEPAKVLKKAKKNIDSEPKVKAPKQLDVKVDKKLKNNDDDKLELEKSLNFV